ncbi:hypothetical protein, partial [Alcanivorax sp. HI0044]|uniref:hypothetical protein n=1 Tax=Alcanivorax sp. HI0044 TaxID=1822234 RepID=UPI000AC7ED57
TVAAQADTQCQPGGARTDNQHLRCAVLANGDGTLSLWHPIGAPAWHYAHGGSPVCLLPTGHVSVPVACNSRANT